jgi:hypothetical protein
VESLSVRRVTYDWLVATRWEFILIEVLPFPQQFFDCRAHQTQWHHRECSASCRRKFNLQCIHPAEEVDVDRLAVVADSAEAEEEVAQASQEIVRFSEKRSKSLAVRTKEPSGSLRTQLKAQLAWNFTRHVKRFPSIVITSQLLERQQRMEA